ncbi:hypothetical protein H2248_001434 [Termitomyces sp. 'cryptogamus']|nr:hypothetical protein H2248_001434 [Termitomyces sp. 'cryptogamus']
MPSLRIVFLLVASTLATMALSLAVPQSIDSSSGQLEKRMFLTGLEEWAKEEAEALDKYLAENV